MKIPSHMSHLPVDEDRGYPIPYVAEWSSETETVLPPPVHPRWGMIVTTHGAPGLGRPLLGAMQPERQRECMEHKFCQVCHVRLAGSMFMAGGSALEWFTEPPTCRRCMVFAVRVCPGLVRGSRHPIPNHRLRIRVMHQIQLAQSRVGEVPGNDINVHILGEEQGGIAGFSSFRAPWEWKGSLTSRSMLYFFMGRPIDTIEYTVEDFLAEYA